MYCVAFWELHVSAMMIPEGSCCWLPWPNWLFNFYISFNSRALEKCQTLGRSHRDNSVDYIALDLMLLFTRWVMSDFSQLHGPQHARLPCLPPSPVISPNSWPLCQWHYLTISSSVVPFSFSLVFELHDLIPSYNISWVSVIYSH